MTATNEHPWSWVLLENVGTLKEWSLPIRFSDHMHFSSSPYMLHTPFISSSHELITLIIFGKVYKLVKSRSAGLWHLATTLKVGAVRSSKMLVSYHSTTWCHNPDNLNSILIMQSSPASSALPPSYVQIFSSSAYCSHIPLIYVLPLV